MPSLASSLLAASALVILFLGGLHLAFTFRGTRLHPRDTALVAAMKEVSPRLTRETSMWKAWVGFNASHSYGAMLFGLVYGYLALFNPAALFGSWFLLLVGLALLLGYCLLGWKYWFSIPFRGILISTALYFASLAANWA
jgi:uncharacterized membrane protein